MIKSWMVIGAVALVVVLGGGLIKPGSARWFNRLQRPRWLTFERAISLHLDCDFICGAWSAYIVWESEPGSTKTWLLMGLYLLLELVTIAYNPVMFAFRSLRLARLLVALVLSWDLSWHCLSYLFPLGHSCC
jgi:tryptophan-rich sensory protein